MTVDTPERTFQVRIHIKEPHRDIRGKDDISESGVIEFMRNVTSNLDYVHVTRPDGSLVVIPGHNFAYAEFMPSGDPKVTL